MLKQMLCFLIRPEIDLKFSTQFSFIGDMVEGDMSRGIQSPRELAKNEWNHYVDTQITVEKQQRSGLNQ